jgi:hypothetical protein
LVPQIATTVQVVQKRFGSWRNQAGASPMKIPAIPSADEVAATLDTARAWATVAVLWAGFQMMKLAAQPIQM